MPLAGSRSDLYCATCGYGAVVSVPPRFCPMCHEFGWTRLPRRQRRVRTGRAEEVRLTDARASDRV
jgi:rRNA maturation protein Nop10